jgi:saccharopine dehydrogenase-like NADP-dependent oxidoreductase
MKRILIFGRGKIGKAFFYLTRKKGFESKFFKENVNLRNFDIYFGALPGKIGKLALKEALKHKKDLIDVSDLEPEVYLKKKKEIEKARISVLPNCGFCPGLLNFLIYFFNRKINEIKRIEVLAGTLSPKKFFYPFLWCFEDLILEHRLPSTQLIGGRKKKFKPFSDLKREKFLGILAEHYFAPSGFEQLIEKIKVKDFIFRVVRPFGFFEFFKFLENQGFLEKENLESAKKILESRIEDNLTFGKINFESKEKKVSLIVKSFSKKKERLNSMQKISVVFPLEALKKVSEGKVEKGLIFPEDLVEKDFSKEIFESLKTNSLISLKFHNFAIEENTK